MGSNHQANLPVWYRLLNCGLRVPASAGTDCFLNRIVSRLPGSDRVYVHCPEKFTYHDWIANLRAGRTFVTNGPMLRFTANGQEAGATIKLAEPGKVRDRRRSARPSSRWRSWKSSSTARSPPPSAPGDDSLRDHARAGTGHRNAAAGSPCAPRASAAPRSKPPKPSPTPAPSTSKSPAARSARPKTPSTSSAGFERLRNDVRHRNRIPAAQQAHVEQQLAGALDFYRKLGGR